LEISLFGKSTVLVLTTKFTTIKTNTNVQTHNSLILTQVNWPD